MTGHRIKRVYTGKKWVSWPSLRRALHVTTLALLIITSVMYSSEITKSIYDGIRLCAITIIPALFPFFIIADFIISGAGGEGRFLSKGFRKIFGIGGAGINAFVCGIVCGFPVGVKSAVELYRKRLITKDECQRLIGFVNNPSLAFVISGVGIGINGSLRVGILLYISTVLSAIAIGALFATKTENSKIHSEISEQKFDLVVSIKNAGVSCLTVSSYIIFFSAVLGVLGAIINNDVILALLAPFFEIGNATTIIAKSTFLSPAFSIMLTGFALGFSGLSVHLQALSLVPNELSKKQYFLMKTAQGILCSVITLFMFSAVDV